MLSEIDKVSSRENESADSLISSKGPMMSYSSAIDYNSVSESDSTHLEEKTRKKYIKLNN